MVKFIVDGAGFLELGKRVVLGLLSIMDYAKKFVLFFDKLFDVFLVFDEIIVLLLQLCILLISLLF